MALNVGYGGGSRKALNNGGGRGRGPITQPRREHLAAQNGGGERQFLDEIELFNTESLVKEVRRLYLCTLWNGFFFELPNSSSLGRESFWF